MKIVVYFLLLLLPIFGISQTVFTFDYSFGKLKPTKASNQPFLNEYKKITAGEVDSVHFIGQSDSVGTFLSNFRTTEIRSQKIKKLLANSWKGNIPYAIYPTAGRWEKEAGSTRKIQVVIYTSETLKLIKNETEIPAGCYRVAYTELQTYRQTSTSRGRKSMVQLFRPISNSNSNRPDLYAGKIDDKGEFEAYRLVWKKVKVKSNGPSEEMEVTEILATDFDRFKIFTIDDFPCTDCHEDFQTNKQLTLLKMERATDQPLMEQLQFKTPIFQKKSVTIRVPQEWIDSDLDYFTKEEKIEWVEKDKDYFYARVNQENGSIAAIQRKLPTHEITNCLEEKSIGETENILVGLYQRKNEVYNFAELGLHTQNGNQFSYGAIGLFTGTKILDLEFLVGLHAKAAIYGAIRARYNLITLPFNSLFSGNRWKQSFTTNRFWYARFYIGTEYKGSIGKHSPNYLEPNVHVGFTFSKNSGSVFHRLFVQYGRGLNFMEESPRNAYNLLQVGIQLQLGKTTYRSERGTF
ncbi:MAG: hypothetical protein WC044_10645 [Crocinitomicaceae bacterium]